MEEENNEYNTIIYVLLFIWIISNFVYTVMSVAIQEYMLAVLYVVSIISSGLLIKKYKIGFWLLLLSNVGKILISDYNLAETIIYTLLTSVVLFGIFQIKCNGVRAWRVLK